jgi:hypothetical protein
MRLLSHRLNLAIGFLGYAAGAPAARHLDRAMQYSIQERDAVVGIDPSRAQEEWDEDAVDEASEQSFPAGDPPAGEPLCAGAPLRTGADEDSADEPRPDVIATGKRPH